MQTVVSNDGTSIAFERTGSGPPLVLVHGTAGSRARWAHIVPALAEQFSVYAMDRRGRGDSGDTEPYAIEREFEDVAVVVEAIDSPVFLYGHSYGGTCALEASLLTGNIRKLILYEPVATPVGVPAESDEVTPKIEQLLDAGDREGALIVFMRELVGMDDSEIENLRESPTWSIRLDATPTIPRENRSESTYRFDAGRFSDMRIPTTMLTGGESQALFTNWVEVVNEALPDSKIVVLPGQGHIADITAPELFMEKLMQSLNDE